MGGRGAISGTQSKNTISKAESNAILEYTTARYEKINSALRSGKKMNKKDEKTVKLLDDAINKSYISNGTVLFRGTSPEELGINKNITKMSSKDVKNLIGQTIKSNTYTSTTKSEQVALGFSGRGEKTGHVTIVITNKGRKKALDVGNNSAYGDKEQEVILPRNASLKITNAKRRLGKLTVYAEW